MVVLLFEVKWRLKLVGKVMHSLHIRPWIFWYLHMHPWFCSVWYFGTFEGLLCKQVGCLVFFSYFPKVPC
uniref:Uncharacterized protein n=1 Tax=Arundo donax TaxID=35708 RepID=A0A0A8YDN4_ARUDO